MKPNPKILLIAVLVIGILLPGHNVAAMGLGGSQVIFGNNFTLKSGETQQGDLVVLGGSVTIEKDALVTGNIVLFGGSLTVAGQVEGDTVLVGGTASLEATAVLKGNLVTVGGSLQRDSHAIVQGEINHFTAPPSFTLNGTNASYPQVNPPAGTSFPPVIKTPISLHPFSDVAWIFLKSLGWAALAALVLLFFERQTRRVSLAVLHQPWIGGSMGLLTLLAVAVASVILTVTIILIPVTLVVLLAVAFAFVFGWIAVGLEVGQRLAGTFHQIWPIPISAALGTFVLNFVANVISLVPCIGWLVPFIIGLLGLGAVVLSRFGTQDYPALGTIIQGPPSGEAPTRAQ